MRRPLVVRFHAMQSILVGAASFVFWMAYSVLGTILSFIPMLGWLVVAAIGFVASVGLFVLWIVLMVRAFQGQEWELPVVGKYARQFSAPAPIG